MSVIHYPLFFRTLRRELEIYGLKIITLSIALACALVVILFCWNEFNYDRFHENADDVFRIIVKNTRYNFEGNRYKDRIPDEVFRKFSSPSSPVSISRSRTIERQTIAVGESQFTDVTLHAVDGNIGQIFSFRVVRGDLNQFTKRNNAAIIDQTHALAYFGTVDCVGRSFGILSDRDTVFVSVEAVVADFPINSHEPFPVLIRFDRSILESLSIDPGDFAVYGRWKMHYSHDDTLQFQQSELNYELQPLPEIYFGRRVIGEGSSHGDRYSILILICIASLITLLALTNFVNLTTLTLPKRAKEIAVKKISGSGRARVLAGLAIESLIVVMIALMMTAVLLVLSNHWINSILPVPLGHFISSERMLLIILVPLLILLTIIGPLVISLRFVRASPTRLLSTEAITFPRFKRIITVVQLTISLSLLVSSVVVKRQITRSLVKEPGRNKDQIVYLKYPEGLTDKGRRNLEREWELNDNIEGIAAVSNLPDNITRKVLHSNIYSIITDYRFLDFFRYDMIEGRDLGADDSSCVVINQKANFVLERNNLPSRFRNKRVIGVTSNLEGIFNQSEKPVIIERGRWTDFNFLCIRIIEVDVRATVAYLERRFGLRTGEVKFLDRKFEAWLVYEDHLGSLCGMLAILSALMAGCAIYGLSLSLGNDKIKQVAIHKMLGASFLNIIRLLMRSFAMPMLIAGFISVLITYIFLTEWLRNFIYKTHMSWEETMGAFIFCGSIIVLTSLRQAQKLSGGSLISYLKE